MRAFWPFSSNANAAAPIFIPDSGTPALTAAVNTDPNPNKALTNVVHTSGKTALLAYAGPSGTIADVVSSTAPDRISVYVVRTGDSLSDIADMFNVSKNTIIWANDLKNASDIHPGDTLIILPVSGVEHTVKKGDTLASLAKKYSADAEEIAQYNGLETGAALEVGATIIVPGGEIGVTVAPKAPVKQGTVKVTGGTTSVQSGYYSNPVPGGIFTQGIHGWNGVDIGGARGTPIYAAAAGTAIIAKSNGAWNGGYGNYVVITHNNGSQTLYSHLSSAVVAPGTSVGAGELIGYMGSTGKSTGVHLHFEVRGAANPFRNCAVGRTCAVHQH